MHRLDYQWKRQLKSEQEQASATRLVNKMLLQNILPHHVGNTSSSHLSREIPNATIKPVPFGRHNLSFIQGARLVAMN